MESNGRQANGRWMEINERRPGDEKEDKGIEEDKFRLYGHVLKRITYKTYGDYNNTLLLQLRNPAALKPHQFFELLQANGQKRLCTTLQTNCGTIQSSKVHDLLRRQIIKWQFRWSRKIHWRQNPLLRRKPPPPLVMFAHTNTNTTTVTTMIDTLGSCAPNDWIILKTPLRFEKQSRFHFGVSCY